MELELHCSKAPLSTVATNSLSQQHPLTHHDKVKQAKTVSFEVNVEHRSDNKPCEEPTLRETLMLKSKVKRAKKKAERMFDIELFRARQALQGPLKLTPIKTPTIKSAFATPWGDEDLDDEELVPDYNIPDLNPCDLDDCMG